MKKHGFFYYNRCDTLVFMVLTTMDGLHRGKYLHNTWPHLGNYLQFTILFILRVSFIIVTDLELWLIPRIHKLVKEFWGTSELDSSPQETYFSVFFLIYCSKFIGYKHKMESTCSTEVSYLLVLWLLISHFVWSLHAVWFCLHVRINYYLFFRFQLALICFLGILSSMLQAISTSA